MRTIKYFFLLIIFSANLYATKLTGYIQTLHVNLQTNRAHVYLVGKPRFSEASCEHYWTANSLDDDKFMIYIWPTLLSAKSNNLEISINTDGCEGVYPKIISFDMSPRQ